ncbi:MAG: hypothetical protein AVDCRST_MAG54-3482 [uncultured Actinomycetospora sp.]|uniref:Uncharacterized protein n=1 Tax=uncultured Actinomycetospora sp. TaxID=1135996 RepID=A0A6J4JGU1_9PSEU|nr:MAG: hypothetical protein AVDCRST_MAG54-3482 [uncultured Actinomycetospora sp.]
MTPGGAGLPVPRLPQWHLLRPCPRPGTDETRRTQRSPAKGHHDARRRQPGVRPHGPPGRGHPHRPLRPPPPRGREHAARLGGGGRRLGP